MVKFRRKLLVKACITVVASLTPANGLRRNTKCTNSTSGCNTTTGAPKPDDFKKFQNMYHHNMMASLSNEECTQAVIAIRRSWDDLDDETRLEYIGAVNCLARKPSLTDKTLAPGAVNRLDDFTYIHINQTNIIHNSGYLLPWHRLFLWRMEEALRNECGYKGYLPYWDIPRFSENQTVSKVWDGSATSLGGNGAYGDPQPREVILPGLAVNFTLPTPAGTGGGCITDGPFRHLQLNLGPVAKEVIDYSNKYGYKANPRCLSRTFDPESSAGVLNWANATTIMQSPDMATFRQGIENLWHRNAHTFIGLEGADPFSPTNDPAFYLLHAQIDHLWAIWQGQDLENRTYAIDGNRTFFGIPLDYAPDVPPSPATIEDEMNLGLGYKPLTKEGMPMTVHGRCYMYI
ncbi:hypothetical protein BJ170DRAFT_713049 [Xylariales sp. AK1849]|nr:hypothetical protein BJ170DRAFT_713049 [Xylariales sp. AK1849]